jgi:hypothetical protein
LVGPGAWDACGAAAVRFDALTTSTGARRNALLARKLLRELTIKFNNIFPLPSLASLNNPKFACVMFWCSEVLASNFETCILYFIFILSQNCNPGHFNFISH